MMKHIIGQAIYQLIVIIILVFTGETFIPESADEYDGISGFSYDWKYSPNGCIRSGR